MNRTPDTTPLAVIGLGAMGARMARRLIDAGQWVTVYDRTPERAAPLVEAGAAAAPTPRDAAAGADVVISMVTDDAASRAVWDDPARGALGGLRPGAIAIESSTVTPARIAALASAVGERRATLLDAPVAGSRPQAEAGALIHLVGGPAAAFETARPILGLMGQRALHVGPSGSGAAYKLAVNALFAIQVAAFAEVIGLLEGAGLDRAQGIERLAGLPITSPAVAGVAQLIAAERFEPQFPIALVAKDLRYARDTLEADGRDAPLSEAAAAIYRRACHRGLGGLNIAGVARLFAPG